MPVNPNRQPIRIKYLFQKFDIWCAQPMPSQNLCNCPGESVRSSIQERFLRGWWSTRLFSFVDFCIFCHCIALRDPLFQPSYRCLSFSFLRSWITGELVGPLISVNPSMPWDSFNFRAPSLPMTELYSFYNSDSSVLARAWSCMPNPLNCSLGM
jgi:hypothetical protein